MIYKSRFSGGNFPPQWLPGPPGPHRLNAVRSPWIRFVLSCAWAAVQLVSVASPMSTIQLRSLAPPETLEFAMQQARAVIVAAMLAQAVE